MDAAWDEYRRRCRAFWRGFLLGPLWLALQELVRYFSGLRCNSPFLDSVAFITALPEGGYFLVTRWRQFHWPCPRCGRPFHLSGFYGNTLAYRCFHCGLPKWAPVKAKAPKSDPVADDDFD
jgi:hypothetical protein